MATEVSSSARTLAGCKEEGEGERELVTRDLLGGEVGHELQVPTAGERRLDLSSGKTYLQQRERSPATCNLHDLNLSPPSLSVASLGLKLEAATSAVHVEYQSVCTLEKVKSALERESRLVATAEPLFPRPDGFSPSPPSTSSSTKRQAEDAGGRMMAVAACPVCLLYVLISTVDPRCPRCTAHVPVNGPGKKPCIDLNFSLQPGNHDTR
ncbi:hypothetical protein MUK42_30845 [Musa troglodytarum]|uniref:GIR1-like zinc ribbon domain-containing protein n=1 Tax=Musa troglodytarum TaxID=320322 RepID=A0A9E7FQ95_9LILI|nr:hypothetical protein MUK42_30845 [Musa troglodytarum]